MGRPESCINHGRLAIGCSTVIGGMENVRPSASDLYVQVQGRILEQLASGAVSVGDVDELAQLERRTGYHGRVAVEQRRPVVNVWPL
jgi:hypothetical protein